MRTRGWGGKLPRDEDEARTRTVEAAMRCVDRYGPTKTTLADVANELGVTRQTVYRLFPTTADLLSAVGEAGTDQFLDRLADHVSGITDPSDAVAEAVVYTLEALPTERYIGLLLQAGETEVFSRGATSSRAMSFGKSVLQRFPIDWVEIGLDDELEGLAEFMLRSFMSFVQYPSDPPRTSDELRAYVKRWLGPALGAPVSRERTGRASRAG
ncbi:MULTISPECIES: TetR/AcrR family transcriptional regulator [unclassified Gordonia (in: high G+C Gram-positive bacteria)]|uniref:TetR/AcrR family transcriptional regulator n=1 Tax=unclassified Gordonia (in: high G+C Gram-positive bacteria) TaxID=2657482 RepID=UPI001F0EEE02|nr:TetR/AcrR family transcriptional regulator [Gordonia sp. ABSL49_1]MCH5641749.1 TetR/AcrR family transcriptional regulator [Gordonia sp. ABSL49_1]